MEELKELELQNVVKEQDNIENVDDKLLAESVSNGIKLEFSSYILVKQLPVLKVKRIVKEPVSTGEKDVDGNDISEMVEKEIDVDSLWREGIVIKLPSNITSLSEEDRVKAGLLYEIGDKVMYRNMRATDFDYIPSAALIEPFNVVCKITK